MKNITVIVMSYLMASSVMYAQMPEPAVIMKTDKFAGESFVFNVAENAGTIVVDWGDGSFESVSVNSKFDLSPTFVTGTLPVDKATIKVYGDIVSLRVGGQMLTQLSFGSVPKIRRLDCQNNLLTSIEGLSDVVLCGTIIAYGNLFDACGIEAIYYSLPDRTFKPDGSPQVVGVFLLMNSTQSDDQNQFVIDSKISIVNAKNWNINNAGVLNNVPEYIIKETTGIGCKTSLKNILGDKVDYSYEPSSGLLKINTNSTADTYKLIIYDATGKIRYTNLLKENDSFILNMKDYSPGLYFVRLNNDVQKLLVLN